MKSIYSEEMDELRQWLSIADNRFIYWAALCREQVDFVEAVRLYFSDVKVPEKDFWYNLLLPIFKLIGLDHRMELPPLDLAHSIHGYQFRTELLQSNPGLVIFVAVMVNAKDWIAQSDRATVQLRIFALLGWLDQYIDDEPPPSTPERHLVLCRR